ncbi:MAG: TolC family protein [Cyclobacteriaceae bacterium]
MRKLFSLLLIACTYKQLSAQDSLASDTSRLSLESVLKMTMAFHPVVKQADLNLENADAIILEAKGQLDPKLALDYNLKDFKETEYYNILSTSFKVPTQIGIDPKVEFSRNRGDFLNPENFISNSTDNRQVAVGFSIPIGKGLFFDERRNTIQQAKAFSQIAKADQLKEINKILFSVVKDYWEWYYSYRKQELLAQAIVLAENLFDRTLIDYEFGEAAVVDTLQAKINYQKRIVDFQKSVLEVQLSKLNLSRHFWSNDLIPLEIAENVLPDSSSLFITPTDDQLATNVRNAMESHPEIQKLEGKKEQLNFDLRWRRESLKPQVDLSYSFIDAPLDPDFSSRSIDFGENYKLGVDFSIPIFLRKERGKLQQTKVKLLSNDYSLAQNQVNIKNSIFGKFAESITLQELLSQYQGVSDNYRRLLNAEIINLQNGEADLFKINIQQDKYIEAQIDFYEAFMKWEKSKADYLHAAGIPYLGLSALFGRID